MSQVYTMNTKFFTYDEYRNILSYIKSKGNPIGSFRECPKFGPYVILRHDVDYSLIKAEEMARIDQELNIQSTFFVLLTSAYYNALSIKNTRIIKRIINMGHEIGLHYDCSGFHELPQDKCLSKIKEWAYILENVTSKQIISIAQHKPAETDVEINTFDYLDAYNARFCKDMVYIRDSAMTFGNIELFKLIRQNSRIQLLIHPIWWHLKSLNIDEVFEYVKQNLSQEINATLQNDEKSIKEWITRQKLEYCPWARPQYRFPSS